MTTKRKSWTKEFKREPHTCRVIKVSWRHRWLLPFSSTTIILSGHNKQTSSMPSRVPSSGRTLRPRPAKPSHPTPTISGRNVDNGSPPKKRQRKSKKPRLSDQNEPAIQAEASTEEGLSALRPNSMAERTVLGRSNQQSPPHAVAQEAPREESITPTHKSDPSVSRPQSQANQEVSFDLRTLAKAKHTFVHLPQTDIANDTANDTPTVAELAQIQESGCISTNRLLGSNVNDKTRLIFNYNSFVFSSEGSKASANYVKVKDAPGDEIGMHPGFIFNHEMPSSITSNWSAEELAVKLYGSTSNNYQLMLPALHPPQKRILLSIAKSYDPPFIVSETNGQGVTAMDVLVAIYEQVHSSASKYLWDRIPQLKTKERIAKMVYDRELLAFEACPLDGSFQLIPLPSKLDKSISRDTALGNYITEGAELLWTRAFLYEVLCWGEPLQFKGLKLDKMPKPPRVDSEPMLAFKAHFK